MEISDGSCGTPACSRVGASTGDARSTWTTNLYLQAEALRRAFPTWSIAVQPWAGDRARIEAVNPHGHGLYALISTDPAELWRELRASRAP